MIYSFKMLVLRMTVQADIQFFWSWAVRQLKNKRNKSSSFIISIIINRFSCFVKSIILVWVRSQAVRMIVEPGLSQAGWCQCPQLRWWQVLGTWAELLGRGWVMDTGQGRGREESRTRPGPVWHPRLPNITWLYSPSVVLWTSTS